MRSFRLQEQGLENKIFEKEWTSLGLSLPIETFLEKVHL